MLRWRVHLLLGGLLLSGPAQTALYSTWAPWEIDSAAAAWVLRRHVDPDARFQSLPKGTQIAGATLDTPDSPFRRGASYTAFDSVIRQHRLESACLKRLTPMIRMLELTPWRKVTDPAAEALEMKLRPLLPLEPVHDGLESAFAVLDAFCQEIGP